MTLPDMIRAIQRLVGAEPDGLFGPLTAGRVLARLMAEADPDAETPEMPELDARTLKHIATLDPKARPAFRDFTLAAKATAATYGCDYVMICGHRTWAEQDALFARRPKVTNARGGYSNHNFGIAADYGVFRGKCYLDSTDAALAGQVHRACAVHAPACGLDWGGDWESFPDLPHYEVATGMTLTQKRAQYEQKGSVL